MCASACCAPTASRSYEQASESWERWNDDVARERVHRTHGELVAVRAERDRSALLPLPPAPYPVAERTTRILARDGLLSFEGRRYAVPDARMGERVELVLGAEEIEAYSTVDGRRLARQRRGAPVRVLPDPRRIRSPWRRCSKRCRTTRCTTARSRTTRRRSVAELISERIARNTRELKLLGVGESADEFVDRAEDAKLGYREFLDLCSSPRSGCSTSAPTPTASSS